MKKGDCVNAIESTTVPDMVGMHHSAADKTTTHIGREEQVILTSQTPKMKLSNCVDNIFELYIF